MSYSWKVKESSHTNIIDQLLTNRGIKTQIEKEKFLNPKIENYKKDINIPGIDQAIIRIKKAIKGEELIIVYGDYDVDGICASAILYKALSSLGAKILPYLPHREKEGYGLSKIGIDHARDSGASLIITVDNGIVAFEQVEYAKSLGIDIIVTDHHLPTDSLPHADVIVHSTQMCGAAVAWCLIQKVVSEKLSNELLQFGAIATVCDMMPLNGVNRAILVAGIRVLQKTENLGLLELFRESGIEKKDVGSYEIGHIIGPRLNAIGRLDHAIDALRLLCTTSPKKARDLAKLLHETNSKRQDYTSIGVEQALLNISLEKKIHIVFSEDWLPGIIGLIAARICQDTHKPAIAISIMDGIAKGSARSVEGINIAEVIRGHSELLIAVGGHKGAAGFSLLPENLEEFIKRVESSIDQFPEIGEPVLEIDAELGKKDITKSLVKELEKLAPFGFGNPEPVFVSRNLKVMDIRTVGSGKHLKLKADGLDIIAFGKGDMERILKSGSLIDVAFNLEINKFNGNETLQLKAKDMKLA